MDDAVDLNRTCPAIVLFARLTENLLADAKGALVELRLVVLLLASRDELLTETVVGALDGIDDLLADALEVDHHLGRHVGGWSSS
jgi:hypothetical protein